MPAHGSPAAMQTAEPVTTTLCRALELETTPIYQLFLPLIQQSGAISVASVTQVIDLPFAQNVPLQTAVLTDTINPEQAAILRGQVCDRSGTLLSGVTVNVLNHPEYGSAQTDAQGQYNLVVNGGELLTLEFTRIGYFPAQRQVDAPWQDYAWLADVALVPPDANVTTIDLTSAQPIQVARGSVSSDADGARQATALFAQGTQAEMVLPDGTTQSLSTLNVRATEYTVGERGPAAMPGELPAASGYTYALEYSVDEALAAGATAVRFSKPVINYVENFLGFPVGSIVPSGYYDRQQGAWVASENGRVIQILTVSNSLVNVDTDGDTVADNNLDLTDAERQQLATLYRPGQSLWRVPLTHFTPWDHNWPFGPPADARPPDQPRPFGSSPMDAECQRGGSIIACQSQTLGEAVPIAGTPYDLYYQSNRVLGRSADRTIRIPLTLGGTLPPSLERIDLQIFLAGRRFDRAFTPAPDQVYNFIWDGKDFAGNDYTGTTNAVIRIGYVYRGAYNYPTSAPAVFAQYGGDITPVSARSEVIVWQRHTAQVSNADARQFGMGGWSLSRHHDYDAVGGVLYLGDGTQRPVEALGGLTSTYAGNGLTWPYTPIITATQAALAGVYGVELDGEGNLYLGDYQNGVIRKVDTNGMMTTIAGVPDGGLEQEGIPATQAAIGPITDLAFGPDGSLYLAAVTKHRIYRVTADGLIYTAVGTGAPNYIGDGIPATSANLFQPEAVAVGPDGSLYVADHSARLYRVGTDGLIHTIAGTGTSGYSGDGGPARQAQIGSPRGLDIGPDGSLYFTDFAIHVIRRIGPDGVINTVAGVAYQPGFSPDGDPGIRLNYPAGLDVDEQGQIYYVDMLNHRVRRIGIDGVVVTVAGTGTRGFGGDGLPGQRALLYNPMGVVVAPDGVVFVADTVNNRVRRIGPPPMSGLDPNELLIPSEDDREVYIFDLTGRHLRTVDGLTGALIETFAYDVNGRLATITDAFGSVTAVQRDANGRPTGILAPGGQLTQLAADANGYLSTITYPTGETISLTTTADGLLTSLTNPRGGTSHFVYDAGGRLIQDENAAGSVTTLVRAETDNGYIVTVTSPLNRATVYTVAALPTGLYRTRIDANGGITAVTTQPDGSQTTTYPDGTQIDVMQRPDPRWGMAAPFAESMTITLPGGLVSTQTMARVVTLGTPGNPFSVQQLTNRLQQGSAVTTFAYTAANRTITTQSATGQTAVAQLDEYGRVVTTTLAAGQTPITYAYNSLGQLTEARQGTLVWTYTYDDARQLISRSNAAGEVISYDYDASGRVIGTTLPGNRTLAFAYDNNGNMTQLTMPDGAQHTQSYSLLNQRLAYTPPGNLAHRFTYNDDRSLASVTLPGGRVLTHTYDGVGRVTGLNYPEASNTFGFAADNLMDRVNTITRTPANGDPAQTITYTYQGQLPASMTWSGAAQGAFTYTYNTRLFLSNLHLTSGGDVVDTALAYNVDGRLTTYGPFTLTRSGPGGGITMVSDGTLNATLAYDAVARPVNLVQQVGGIRPYQATLSYDSTGRIAQQVELVNGSAITHTYIYNPGGSLAQVQRNGVVVESYDYDLNGNRVSRQLNGGDVETAVYDAQDRLQSLGGTTYQFDVDGFLTQRGSDTFQYSTRGELLSATISGQTITYAYDGLNRLVARTGASGTAQYLYGNPSNPFQVTASRSTAGVLTYYYYDENGRVFAFERSGARYYVATDQVGSPRTITNASGQIVRLIEYDSFGNVVSDTAPGFDLPVGFAGGLTDAATGLIRFGYRDYDPQAGRWTARDPLLFGGGQANLYVYVNNNPVNFRDPTGLFCIGVSAYAGFGGGVQTCITEDGASLCGEIGLGVGVDAGIDNGGLESPGSEVGFEGKMKAGPVGVGAGIKFDECGLGMSAKGELGPVAIELDEGLGLSKVGLQPDIEQLPGSFLEMGRVELQAKLYGKICTQGRW